MCGYPQTFGSILPSVVRSSLMSPAWDMCVTVKNRSSTGNYLSIFTLRKVKVIHNEVCLDKVTSVTAR